MKKLYFIAELGFNSLSKEDKDLICNGAGAADDWKSKFIPNTLWGLDCREVFDIHDYGYHVGQTDEDKSRVDMCMLVNLIRLINCYGGFLAYFRRHRAIAYYDAVHDLGYSAFFANVKKDIEDGYYL